MESTTEIKFPLTWKPYGTRKGKKVSGGQWVKKINGKQKSFGSAPNKRDRDAREAALASYQLSQQDGKLQELAQKWFREQAIKLGLDPDNPVEPPAVQQAVERDERLRREQLMEELEADLPADLARYQQQQALERLNLLAERSNRLAQAPPKSPEQLSFDEVVEKYLDSRRLDYRLTQTNADQLPRKRQLTRTTLNTIESHLKELSRFAGNKPWEGGAQAESVLSRYSDHLQQKMIRGEYKAWTVNTKLRKIHTFFEWCVSEGHLDHPPRNLKKATSCYATKKGGQGDLLPVWVNGIADE